MSEKESPDTTVGKELLLPPDAIRNARLGWNTNHIMRAVFTYRLNDMLRERRQKLETVSVDGLKALQSEIDILNKTLHAITKTET